MSEPTGNQEDLGSGVHLSKGIFIRIAFLAEEMCLHPQDKLRFERIGTRAVSVDFENIGGAGGYRRWRSSSVQCTGTVYWQISRRAYALYQALSAGNIPDEIDPNDLSLCEDVWNRSMHPVFRHTAPAFVKDAIAPIEAEIERVVSRVVGLVRWRCNRAGPVDLPRLGPHDWSVDGKVWRPDVCRPALPVAAFGPDLVVSETRRADIQRFLEASEDEPLYQNLIREAESLLESNPRSAVAIGATAAEVAVKALVSKLAPQTSWLIQNLPSPPIIRILEEYLPALLLPGTPRFDVVLIKNLKVAVLLRNDLIHGAKANPEPTEAASALATFRDIAWLCDYFSGVAWAANRVSQRFREAMNIPTTVNANGWFVD